MNTSSESKNTTTRRDKTIQVPLLAVRGLVLFEKMTLHFDVGRSKSILALKKAMEHNRRVFLTTQQDSLQDDPKVIELYQTGVVATIKQMLKGQDGVVHVVVTGDFRAKIAEITQESPHIEVSVKSFPLSKRMRVTEDEMEALMRLVKSLFERYSSLIPKMSQNIVAEALEQQDPYTLFQAVAFNTMMKVEDRQKLLETNRIDTRLVRLVEILEKECELLTIEQDIYDRVKQQMDKHQRDYYLREQIRVIENELGEGDDTRQDATIFAERISEIKNIAEEHREKLYKEVERLYKASPHSQETGLIRTYLEQCLDLPWDLHAKYNLDLGKAERALTQQHYGLQKVKERVLEHLSVRKLKADFKGQIVCLAGPPGVGKTSVVQSIAKTLGRPYVRIALGGVRDESDIRGHRKTYIGAMPGRIINALKQAKYKNPIILLDEIDKMGHDFRGDPASALLEVLDREQNHSFRDHYIEIPFDLSEVLFITTANDTSMIPGPLLDRMDVISLSSYTREEKFHIAKQYLIPKLRKQHGLASKDVSFKDEAIYILIDCYTRESGVRKLERVIASICRKVARKKVIDAEGYQKANLTITSIEALLGPKKYRADAILSTDTVGVVTGLAWTSVGGETMEIEAGIYEGNGKIQVTGNLGEVMQESAKLAVSYVRGIASDYCIDPNFYKTKDIHIHAPEGAVPKDGPSAGVTMTTALVSALSGIAVRRDVAMTGEISLRGRVLAIGGLKEKAIAAYRAGVSTVLIPYDNQPDIAQFDPVIQEKLQFIPVRNLAEVLSYALVAPTVSRSPQTDTDEVILIPPDQSISQGRHSVI